MSSRWISTRARACGCSPLTAAWAALTRELLPVPRAPHSSTLLAGSPAAKRRVLSSRMSRTRSIPRNSPSLDAVDLADRLEPAAIGMPNKGVGGIEIDRRRRGWGEAFERIGDAPKQRQQIEIGHRSINGSSTSGRKGADAITGGAAQEMCAIPGHCSLTRHRVPIAAPCGPSFAGGRRACTWRRGA